MATTAVTVTFTLNSATATTPPYVITGISGRVDYDGGVGSTYFNTWSPETVGTPQTNGAAFNLSVTDAGYNSANNATSIGNWAVTFVPRSPTTADSPFGNNIDTITGSGGSNSNGTFVLNIGNNTIKNAGGWDWALMVQIIIPNVGTHCFASDPEMDVS